MRALLTRLRWPLLGGAAALLITTATALAGSGVGATFDLGVTNTVDAQTTLSGNPGGNPLLRLTGTGTAATMRVDAGTAVAINGISNSGTGQFGQSTSGTGLLGVHTGATGAAAGVEGRSASDGLNAVGVVGKMTSPSADASSAGVEGLSSGHGSGVVGQATGPGAAGVQGVSTHSSDGVGVLGSGLVGITGCAPLSLGCPTVFVAEHIGGFFEASGSGGHGIVSCAGVICNPLSNSPGGVAGQFHAGSGGIGVHVVSGQFGGRFFATDTGGTALDTIADQGSTAHAITAHSEHGIGVEATTTTGPAGIIGHYQGSGLNGKGLVGTTSATGGVNAFGVFGQATGTNGIGVGGESNTGANAVGVLGRSSSGLAGRFEGNVHVTGRVTRDYTAGVATAATPIAYGVVNSSGTLVSGTSNVTASFDSANKRYLVTIAGETYSNTGFATFVTPSASSTVPLFPTTSALNGQLLVRVWNLAGNPAQSAFSFVTYKP
jgi:hypothetical protein